MKKPSESPPSFQTGMSLFAVITGMVSVRLALFSNEGRVGVLGGGGGGGVVGWGRGVGGRRMTFSHCVWRRVRDDVTYCTVRYLSLSRSLARVRACARTHTRTRTRTRTPTTANRGRPRNDTDIANQHLVHTVRSRTSTKTGWGGGGGGVGGGGSRVGENSYIFTNIKT